ncbi:Guanyl-specific ribonuclease Sa [Nocardia amikacinitolerans]|uniref:ribonuclease domain-containing protein n=1 Tax=Nocardia amikacinitolerans TaxID=756689 RepID=UPI00082EBDE6|nr:ribonuclease domain-containing protein [Nocardia amikacinitolerans]MCP2295482.1 Guanyl-specific ribonuclease Sa [Nocardia amikacinitolerans]MCP2318936.1 Guanyl-specific ribonuclease Sa [Nocardia amikacinitolerans]
MNSKVIRALGALGAVAVVLLVAVLALRGGSDTDRTAGSATTTARATATATDSPARSPATPPAAATDPAPSRAQGVPERAYVTLAEIDAGRWPDSANAPGTKGGERWMNREGTLPRTDAAGRSITYREWDVNPKQRNRSRDAERIVTGSDGTAWYTGDHYETFTRMR